MSLLNSKQFNQPLSITGSLFGTASWSVNALSSSFALTASYLTNASTDKIVVGNVTASVSTTGDIFFIKSASVDLLSVTNTGTTTISGSADNLFFVKGIANKTILTVSQSGIVIFATQSVTPTGTAPNGGLTFTATDFFVGLD